jgi:hypothetical protein
MAKRPLGVAKSPSMVFMLRGFLENGQTRASPLFYGFEIGDAWTCLTVVPAKAGTQ